MSLSRCLSELRPQARRVLILRSGLGLPHPYSGAEAAQILRIAPGYEARLERGAVVALRGGECAGAGAASVGVTVLSAIHRALSGAGASPPPLPATSSVAPVAAPKLHAAHPPRPPSPSRRREHPTAISAGINAGIGPAAHTGPGAVFWTFIGLVLLLAVALLMPHRSVPGTHHSREHGGVNR